MQLFQEEKVVLTPAASETRLRCQRSVAMVAPGPDVVYNRGLFARLLAIGLNVPARHCEVGSSQ